MYSFDVTFVKNKTKVVQYITLDKDFFIDVAMEELEGIIDDPSDFQVYVSITN